MMYMAGHYAVHLKFIVMHVTAILMELEGLKRTSGCGQRET